jgi:hypothetical protein
VRVALSAILLLGSACGPIERAPAPSVEQADAAATPEAGASTEDFREIGVAAGLTNSLARVEATTFASRMGGGACVFDADGDGRLDVFLPQLAAGDSASHLFLATGPLRYRDATSERGLAHLAASSCLATDLDGDGDRDLVVVGQGRLSLFDNAGATFVDVSSRLPPAPFFVDPQHFYSAVVAFDADDDGDLDLAIGDYGRFVRPSSPCAVTCELLNTFRDGGVRLLLQKADGAYEDGSALLAVPRDMHVLTLLATDLDEDGRIDLFVGVDSPTDFDLYFRNLGPRVFVESAKELGVAANARLGGISTMSSFDADFDGDGHLDLVESSWQDDPDSLFRCRGAKGCTEIGEELELFRTPRNLRWGQALVDLDDDGTLELIESASHVYRPEDLLPVPDGGPTFTIDGPSEDTVLLWKQRDGKLVLQPRDGVFALASAGRGLLATDLDGDGDLDVLLATAYGRPLLLENTSPSRGHHVTIELVGKGKNPRAVGARVEVLVGARHIPAIVHAGLGYLSSDDSALHFGVGSAPLVNVDVRWPSGAKTHLERVPAGKVIVEEP